MGLINTIYTCVSVGYTLANASSAVMSVSYIMLSTGFLVTRTGFNVCKYGFNQIFGKKNQNLLTYKKIDIMGEEEEVSEEYILEI